VLTVYVTTGGRIEICFEFMIVIQYMYEYLILGRQTKRIKILFWNTTAVSKAWSNTLHRMWR